MLSRRLEYQITGRDLSSGAFASVQRNIGAAEQRLTSFTRAANTSRAALGAITLTGFGAGVALRDLGGIETQLIRLRSISSNFNSDLQFLERTASTLGLRFSDITRSFTQISTLETIGLLDPGQARDLAVGFENAAKQFGTSSGDIDLALRGVRQALTQTVVRAQEFDQIFDAVGAIQPAVARQLGITTKAFQQMRSSGDLLAKDLVAALIPAFKEYEGAAVRAAASIDGGFRTLGRTYENVLRAFEAPISGGFQDLTSGIEAAFQPIINNADAVSAGITGIGTAILAAYGGRAAGAVADFAVRQGNAVRSTFAHSAALVEYDERNRQAVASQRESAQQLARTTQARLDFNRTLVASLASERASLQTQLQQTQTLQQRTPIYQRLAQITEQQRSATVAVTEANQANVTAQQNLNRAYAAANARVLTLTATQRASIVAANAAAVAQRGLSAALGLFGGPAGLAVIAAGALILKYREATQVTRDLASAVRDVEDATVVGNSRALSEISAARLAAEQKIKDELQEQLSIGRQIREITAAGAGDSPFAIALESQLERSKNTVAEIRANLDRLEFNRQFANQANEAEEAMGRLEQTTNRVRNSLEGTSRQNVLDEIFPDRSKLADIDKLRQNLDDLLGTGQIQVSQFREANAALDEQLNKINGVTEARRRATQEQEKQLESLAQLRDGALTEVERIQQTFNNNEANIIRLRATLGDEFINQNEADALIRRYEDVLNRDLQKVEDRRAEALIRANERAAREQERIFNAQLQRQRATAEAIGVANPLAGINENFQIELNLLDRQLQNKEIKERDFRARRLALEIQNANDIKEAIESLPPAQLSAGDFFGSDRGQRFFNDQTSALFNVLQRDVGNYIDIQDQWTDAEKARAQRSNTINRRQFEQNKRFQIANAIVQGYTAVQNAFAGAPWPFNYVAAGIAAATAAKQVRSIRSTSFGSSGTVNFGGSVGAGSASDNAQSISEQNSNGGGTQVIMVTQIPPNLEGAINNDWLYRNQQRNLAEMVRSGVISSDTPISISNAASLDVLNQNNSAVRRAF